VTSFWSGWIIILTSITIVLITWLLFSNRKKDNGELKTTGHVYDGLEEFDNPLPAWWFYMFVITIVFAIGYLIAYPGMGNFKGLLGWTSVGQYEHRVEIAEAKYRADRDRYLALSIEEIAHDKNIRRMGQRLFGNNCAQCHGSDARGAYGFPNLTDKDWLYGGTPDAIKTTLLHGRKAAMPAWQAILGDQGINETTQYLLAMNNRDADPELATAGKTHFTTYCTACHGPEGKGNQMLGAPNLSDGIWLYGGTAAQITQTLRSGRNGAMPAFGDTLSEDKIHILTAWVYGLREEARGEAQ
jgi:cytochrome c oxidase cbb3-type subunit 3